MALTGGGPWPFCMAKDKPRPPYMDEDVPQYPCIVKGVPQPCLGKSGPQLSTVGEDMHQPNLRDDEPRPLCLIVDVHRPCTRLMTSISLTWTRVGLNLAWQKTASASVSLHGRGHYSTSFGQGRA